MLEENLDSPEDESLFRSEKNTKLRARISSAWKIFTETLSVDTNKLWLDLCEDSQPAARTFATFLQFYVQSSVKHKICLGPKEYEKVNTIGRACTIQDVWSCLVSMAQDNVLKPFRLQYPDRAKYLTLRYSTRGGKDHGPAGRVAQLIPSIAIKTGLSLVPLYEKREMTDHDVISILHTIWWRASDIPCSPLQRICYSAKVTLQGIGGWRYASLNIKYKDIEMAWLRDPRDPTKHGLLRTFISTTVPFKPICLLTYIVAVAIAKGAFAEDYTHAAQILYPGPLLEGHNEYVPLKWKKEILEEPVLPLAYSQFNRLWHRTLLVAGLRDDPRPYSMRVGAAGPLDGALSSAVRSYVFGNTEDVFCHSYNPENQRANLMQIAFGDKASDGEHAISKFHGTFTKRDPYAPIYITQEDLRKFEDRSDLTLLRQRLQDSTNKEEREKLVGQIQHIRETLEDLLILKRRKDYFAEVDRLRSKQQPTSHLHHINTADPRAKMHKLSSIAAEKLARHLAKEGNESIGDRLVAYVRGASFIAPEPGEEDDDPYESSPRARCLLCWKTFATRATLTRHVEEKHADSFKQPLWCSECKQAGRQDCLIPAGLPAWSNHVERTHGKLHAPNVQRKEPKSAYCLLYKNSFIGQGFNLHLGSHVRRGTFTKPFPCPECQQQRTDDHMIRDKDHWLLHVKNVHGGGQVPGAVFLLGTGKRKAAEECVPKKRQKTQRAATHKEDGRHQCSPKPEGSPYWETPWEGEMPDQDPGSVSGHTDEEFWITGQDEDYNE
ncbi:hypothetical protein QQZ08_007532 [Neonectria magnoliae]|uniref:C2H2-type domain-containing protein n=1 Tax=Neonectria magnoliae TaxID=2732573 RepID=A0ABR1HXE7_9HYPO